MSELGVIPNGALLIRNGIIEEAGPARRVENLAAARNAREVDASGRIVMPAFVDPDIALVSPRPRTRDGDEWDPATDNGAAIRVTSRHNVEIRAAAVAAERARYGCMTAGSHTGCASDLKNVIKILRVQRLLQSKPLRIRSIFSWCPVAAGELAEKWLPAIRKEKLASVIDLSVDLPGAELQDGGRTVAMRLLSARDAGVAAAAGGFAIRVRSLNAPEPSGLLLALSGGAISIIAPLDNLQAFTGPLAAIGCVRVVPISAAFDRPEETAVRARDAISGGSAIALSSTYRAREASSFNTQFLLHLAVYRLGLSAEEAIVATTYNAACSLRMSHVTGSLEPGKSADLLVMDVPDYRELPRRAGHNDIALSMRAGRVMDHRPGSGFDLGPVTK